MTIMIEKNIKRIMMIVGVGALFIALTGLSSCKKADDSENNGKEAILEQEGDLEIIVPEGEETFGE